MGQVISEFLGANPEEDVKETIEILQKLVSAKLQAYATEMEAKAFEDKSLPILAVVDKTEKYMVKVSEGGSANVGSVVDDLFNGKFLDGLKHLVKTAMDELLGNASAGEKEKRECHVVYANNSILRVDYHMYKYDFSSHGLRDKAQNAFCYVVQVSVLDLKRVDPQVVLYELDRAVGEGSMQDMTEKLHQEAGFMEDLYKVLSRLRNVSLEPPTEENREPLTEDNQ
ncbi:hypothetical protein ABFA07_003354 [Porites harrisoni]